MNIKQYGCGLRLNHDHYVQSPTATKKFPTYENETIQDCKIQIIHAEGKEAATKHQEEDE